MKGLNGFSQKQRRAQRRRNHIARDLRTPKYGPRIKESKKQHLIDEAHQRDAEEEYWFYKTIGMTTKE